MKKNILYLFLVSILSFTSAVHGEDNMKSTTIFTAGDLVIITADMYIEHPKDSPFIILFHQANSSRGEYIDIAPTLNDWGFNAMAIDQRSGSSSNGITNQTRKSARDKGKSLSYMDAASDLKAAISYVRDNHADGKIIIWGSSYSAALVLLLSGRNEINADGILSFSPGEYLGAGNNVSSASSSIDVPVFITSAKNEKNNWWNIYQSISSEDKTYFLPQTKSGRHGSSTLFSSTSGSEEYWQAVEEFLKQYL